MKARFLWTFSWIFLINYTGSSPSEPELVMDKCYNQYKLLTANDEPSRNGNILDIKSANGNFKNVANHLQVPGYDDFTEVRRRRRSLRHVKESARARALPARHIARAPHQNQITYSYSDYEPSHPTTSSPISSEPNWVERTEIVYRVTKDIQEFNLCEVETFYVRRYHRFPFFVKRVTCQKNASLRAPRVICRERYEVGHVLRLEAREACEQGDTGNSKWVHDWETRVVGCDAVVIHNEKKQP